MDGQRKRHCWECRRRYLVCDSIEPACKRCSSSGIECPGYSDVKPIKIKWLVPGKVKSRGQTRKGAQAEGAANGCNKLSSRGTTTELAYPTTGGYETIPRLEMMTDACALAQGVEYFNSCIYPAMIPTHSLGKHPYIYSISATHLKIAVNTSPDYLKFSMLSMLLGHRINQMRGRDLHVKQLAKKLYLYWGLAVRSLSERLDMEDERTSDMALAGILLLLLTDIQQGTSLNWRCHLDGLWKLIALRGGFDAVAESRGLDSMLLCLWFVAVTGNTTCPASDMSMADFHLNTLESLLRKYNTAVFTFSMCPPLLFVEIIRINHLRMRAISCNTTTTGAEDEDLSQKAYRILQRIHDFLPEPWAESKPSSRDDWILLGGVYQAAVGLYCILSLQSVSVLPTTPALEAHRTTYGQLLQLLLTEALSSPGMKQYLIWPLVILGVQAVNGGAAMRSFVAKQLPELSREFGTYVPLTAKQVLEVFWDSGETRWDACFDRPYAFTLQIAVDLSRIIRP